MAYPKMKVQKDVFLYILTEMRKNDRSAISEYELIQIANKTYGLCIDARK